MRRVLLFLGLILLFGSSLDAVAQEQIPVERKYQSLKRAEVHLFQLPYEIETIKNDFYPEVLENRALLAPNYPDISQLPRTMEARDNAFISWIETFPNEYQAYYDYLTNYITDKKAQQ